MLTSIELTGFRGFQQLKLEGLKRVNLIVGKNNSGKTSLLEGICDIFFALEKMPKFRHKSVRSNSQWIKAKNAICSGLWQGEDSIVRKMVSGDFDGKRLQVSVLPVFQCTPEDLVISLGMALLESGTEQRLEELLRQIDPRISRIRIDPSVPGNQIVLDVGLPKMIPISELGQGIYRLVEIVSEIVSSKSYVCLIDEIENGIYHASLVDVWRGLAILAEETGVQIFVTTHSHECIEAAHEVFSERDIYDLSVIQLFRKTISVQGRVLDQEHIAAAMEGNIDLRGG